MGELFKMFMDFIQFLWPLRIVEQWESGGYFIFGRWQFPVQPGMYFIVPWFSDVKTISLAEAIIGTGRQDIILEDETVLSFSAMATVKVVDPYLALIAVDEYKQTAQEILCAVLAARLAEVDVKRLNPERRRSLHTDLTARVEKEASEYGMQARRVRFTSFLTNVRTHRLLIDTKAETPW